MTPLAKDLLSTLAAFAGKQAELNDRLFDMIEHNAKSLLLLWGLIAFSATTNAIVVFAGDVDTAQHCNATMWLRVRP